MHSTNRKLAVAVRHVGFEDLGTFQPVLESRGFDVRLLDAAVDDLDSLRDADLAIVLGGPVSANAGSSYPMLAVELDALQLRLRRDAPTLGICLGAQLIAQALGARVYSGESKEIGWGTIDLTPAGIDSPLHKLKAVPVLHWHGDTFDIPDGATRLASTDNYPNQAFAWGRRALALQFHAEVPPSRIEHWLLGHAVELSTSGIAPGNLRDATKALPAESASAGSAMLRDWLESIGL